MRTLFPWFDVQDAEALDFASRRARMVEEQIRARGVTDPEVLRAMRLVPRHAFVPGALVPHAYEDRPLAIGHGQTISQPYIVAYMTKHLALTNRSRVLEVGTGCGYQTAVLATLAREVFSIEIVPPLAEAARERLERLGHRNVHLRTGDGARGWPEEAPFDAIIVACSAPEIPRALKDQLAPQGRLICPVGTRSAEGQDLIVAAKDREGRIVEWSLIPVRFVPLTGPSGHAS